jgi:hypothetical protein
MVGGWWARFTFNSITRCEKGTYALVGGDELSNPGTSSCCSCAATARRSAARSRTGFTDAPGAAASAAGPMSTRGPRRWTRSCPGTTAAQATSATCRPSASAAMPADATAVCRRRRSHRFPLPVGQRTGAAGERISFRHYDRRVCVCGCNSPELTIRS